MTLKELRETKQLTQAEVAKKLDVNQSAVSHWERGSHNITQKYLKKLAAIYGVTVDELLSDKKGANTVQ